MTSQLNVDTIVDKAGSGGSNVKMANTSTYVGEGGSGTQNTVQGLTKAWLKTTTASAISDSFNVTSINDVATGQEQVTFTSAFNNTTYAATGTSSENAYHNVVSNWNETVTTTLTRFGSLNVNAGAYQDTVLNCQVNGDLA